VLSVTPGLIYQLRHGAVTFFTFVGLYMLASPSDFYKKRVAFVLVTLLGVGLFYSIRGGYAEALFDVRTDFSGSRAAAGAIVAQGCDKPDTLIVSGPVAQVSSINPYLKNVRQFLYPQGFRSFARWQEHYVDIEDMVNKDYIGLARAELASNPGKYTDCLIIVLKREEETITLYDNILPKIFDQPGEYRGSEGYVIYKLVP
jgi:hypothetical protein